MKAIILNSGMGKRMGSLTKEHPKCMTDIYGQDTILSRQLKILDSLNITDIIITTGYFDGVLIDYCNSLNLKKLKIKFVNNPIFDKTNYIYSIYCAKDYIKDDDILLLHGDLVFDKDVLQDMILYGKSCMKTSSTLPLPDKDFKAVVRNGRVFAVGIEFFESAREAQAVYCLKKDDWNLWLNKIIDFCDSGNVNCYAEVALNEILDKFSLHAFDAKDRLCTEIDNKEDLDKVNKRLGELNG